MRLSAFITVEVFFIFHRIRRKLLLFPQCCATICGSQQAYSGTQDLPGSQGEQATSTAAHQWRNPTQARTQLCCNKVLTQRIANKEVEQSGVRG